MKKWEYKTVSGSLDKIIEELNRLGSQGWELVIVLSQTGYAAFLKREK